MSINVDFPEPVVPLIAIVSPFLKLTVKSLIIYSFLLGYLKSTLQNSNF